MLDIYNHLSYLALLFVVVAVMGLPCLDMGRIEWLKTCLKITAPVFIACELLAWSIWYLSGATV